MPASEQGIESVRYTVVPRVLVFLRSDDEILLLKGSTDKRLWAGKYNGIGGHVEVGEDPLTAAYRELSEEAGLYVNISKSSFSPPLGLWLCGILVVNTGKNPGICIFIYTGEAETKKVLASSEGSLHWVKISEVDSLPVVEDLPILLDRIINMKFGEPPFSAHSFYKNEKLVVNIFP